MAFKGLRFAGFEWKNITASKIMWVVIAAIAIMPLLYGALYLAAFQDPYARLNAVPVAVVNADKGAVIAQEPRNLGDGVVDELKGATDGLQWNFVSAEEAQKGLENGAYFMSCTIPADFSESVSSVETSAPEKAQLKIKYNQSENMLASQIGETVWKEVRTRVSNTISSEYWTAVLGRVADSGRDIGTAAEGAGTLNSGLVTARDGSKTITENLGTLKDGAITLEGGLGTLSNGTLSLARGTKSLVSGADQLKDGSLQVAGGATDVSRGATQLQDDGTRVLAAGAGQLAQQTSTLPDQQKVQEAEAGSQQITNGIDALKGAAGQLAGGTVSLQGAAGRLSAGVNDVQDGVASMSAGLQGVDAAASEQRGILTAQDQALEAALAALGTTNPAAKAAIEQAQAANVGAQQYARGIEAGVSDMQVGIGARGDMGTSTINGGLNLLVAGVGTSSDITADTLYGGINLLATGIGAPGDTSTTTLYGGLNVLGGGYQSLSSQLLPLVQQSPALRAAIVKVDRGASQVNANMSTLVAGTLRVADGANQVDEGVSLATSGANQLNEGATQLTSGAQSAKEGSAQIATGATQLQDGSATLTTGLHDAVDGSGKLATKLAEGATTAVNQTTNISGKSEVMSSPVELTNSYYTTVKNYGTGFAPYFMALGLWVGGLVAGFVFKPLNNRLIVSGGKPLTVAFANYLPMAFFSFIQATLLMVVLQFGLQLQIDNVPAFYAMGYLTALVFAAIMQFFMAAFGFPGKFLAIILLMLQLTACAGTFPIQTTPEFFQAINPYMPMTYVVQALRQIMTGLDYSAVAFDCLVLFAVGAVCFALTCFVAWRKRTVRMEDIHPVLQLG